MRDSSPVLTVEAIFASIETAFCQVPTALLYRQVSKSAIHRIPLQNQIKNSVLTLQYLDNAQDGQNGQNGQGGQSQDQGQGGQNAHQVRGNSSDP